MEWDRRLGPERLVVDAVCLVPDVPTFFAGAIHPYSRRLLRAAAAATGDRRGTLSSVGSRAERGGASCPYAPRCPFCLERCTREAPSLDPSVLQHRQELNDVAGALENQEEERERRYRGNA